MKTCGFAGLAVLLALLGSTSSLGKEGKEAAAFWPAAPGQCEADQGAELPQSWIATKQWRDDCETTVAAPRRDRIRVLSFHRGPDYKIRIVEPDPSVDYKIICIRPNPNIDYKIRNIDPGGRDVYVVPRSDGRKSIIINPKPRRRSE